MASKGPGTPGCDGKGSMEAGLFCDNTSGVLRRGALRRRVVGPRDVDIEVLYCGICHSDVHSVRGEWEMAAWYPMCPGHEAVGKVRAVGAEVSKFKVGDNVGVGVFVDSCRECDSCRSGEENYCVEGFVGTYNHLLKGEKVCVENHPRGEVTHGGYSTGMVIDEHNVFAVPDTIPLEAAGPLLCAGITTYSPLVHWGAKAGGKDFTVAVVGFGGLGHMAVKLAIAMGNNVLVVSTSPRKKAAIEEFGATFVNSKEEDDMSCHFRTVDLIINTVSAQHDPQVYFPLLKVGGTQCLVGLPPKPLAIKPFKLVGSRVKFAGSCIGGVPETQEMLNFCGERGVVPSVDVISADKVNEAYKALAANAASNRRFVIDCSTIPGDEPISDAGIDHTEWETLAKVYPDEANLHAKASAGSHDVLRLAMIGAAAVGVVALAVFGVRKAIR